VTAYVDEDLMDFLAAHSTCCVHEDHVFAFHTALLTSPWLEQRVKAMREELLEVHWNAWSLNGPARDLPGPVEHNALMVDELLRAVILLFQGAPAPGRPAVPQGPPRASEAETGG
jgi:hypothetical protein